MRNPNPKKRIIHINQIQRNCLNFRDKVRNHVLFFSCTILHSVMGLIRCQLRLNGRSHVIFSLNSCLTIKIRKKQSV